MKKLILTAAAVFSLTIAAAQTDPKQVPQPVQPTATPVQPAKTDLKAKKPIKEADMQTDAVTRQQKVQGEVQPRKDEIKTQNHAKSTSKPAVMDTLKPTMNEPTRRRQ